MKVGGIGFFRQATLRLCSSLEIEKAMFNCLSYLHNYLPASEMLLIIFDPNLGLIHNLARVDLAGIRKPIPSKSLSEEAIDKINFDIGAWKEVKILDRLELHPAGWILSGHVNLSTTSMMYISLVIEGKHLGSLIFLAEGKWMFKNSHAGLVSQLREPFNIAVSNALRYREVIKLKEIVDDENLELTRELRNIKEN